MQELFFRWLFVFVLTGMLAISTVFRYRARRAGETIPRGREGGPAVLVRLLFALPLFGSYLLYAAFPGFMAWSALALPIWLRVLAGAIGLAVLPALVWVFTSIGSNISETVLTKSTHELVTHGPYRWVRHPLYAVASVALVALALLAANWFMLGMAIAALVGISTLVIPKEEAELTRHFGEAYRSYSARTGRLVPIGLWPRRRPDSA